MIDDDEMTDDELNQIESRCKAATPGPWDSEHAWMDGGYIYSRHWAKTPLPGFEMIEHAPDCCPEDMDEDEGPFTFANPVLEFNDVDSRIEDIVFMTNAREDIPRLLAEIRRLRAIKKCPECGGSRVVLDYSNAVEAVGLGPLPSGKPCPRCCRETVYDNPDGVYQNDY